MRLLNILAGQYLTEIRDFYLSRTRDEVRKITKKWPDEYNGERPYQSLDDLALEEYRVINHHAATSEST